MANGKGVETGRREDFAPGNTPPRVLVLSTSPRRDGNSRLLADALAEGARRNGGTVELVYLADHIREFGARLPHLPARRRRLLDRRRIPRPADR